MGAPSKEGCSGGERGGAGLTDTQSPALGRTHRQESFVLSRGVGEGSLGRPPPKAGPKVHARVCQPPTAWARGPGVGGAGCSWQCTAGQPQSEAGPPHSPSGSRHRRLLCPPPVALPGGGAGRLPSPPPQAEAPSLRFLSHARCASRLARAWHGLSSASPPWGEGPAVPAPPQPPGSAGGNCGVLQGGRTVRGACTRRGSFGTGRGQGQEPEGLGGPARHHLTFSSRKGRPQPSAQGPSPWAASRPARSRS